MEKPSQAKAPLLQKTFANSSTKMSSSQELLVCQQKQKVKKNGACCEIGKEHFHFEHINPTYQWEEETFHHLMSNLTFEINGVKLVWNRSEKNVCLSIKIPYGKFEMENPCG